MGDVKTRIAMTPKISVIIPVYNHANELADCLRSLEKQTFQDFEIIIVDDGSAEPVANATIRFEKNRGAPAARNEGFRRAKGENVIILDADIVLRPDALEKMDETLEAHPEAAFAYPSHRFGFKVMKGRPFDVEALKRGNFIHTSALIRRDHFSGFDESLKRFQDWDLFLTMAESGKRGVWINEVLFTVKPHGTMSQWVPSFVHNMPWPIFGWTPAIIRKYCAAEQIIREKHGIIETVGAIRESPLAWFGMILLIEALSVIAVFYPLTSSIFAILAGIVMFAVTFLFPEIGFAAIVVEHMIGSKGRHFAFGADTSHDGGISLRIILFAAFFLGWFAYLLKARRIPDFRAMLKDRVAWLMLGVLVLIGCIQGWIRQNPYLVSDANAWGAFLLLIPALDLARNRFKELRQNVFLAAKIAIAWVSAKTLALFYFFSHDFGAAWEPVYLWVRRTGVGEVTRIVQNASAYRVFFQSHIYHVLASVGIVTQMASRKSRVTNNALKALAILFAVSLISFSRSFWIGLAAGFLFVGIILLRRKTWSLFPKLLISGMGGILIVYILFMFPFPPSAGNLGDAILARADTGESAAQSRWELLPVLNREIIGSPIIGYGFGKTATYRSSDPRVVEATGGEYTTYAFEWGWHDMALKLGLLGVIIYLWALYRLIKRLGSDHRAWQIAIVTLGVIHIFTPYLSHPLGIMVIVLAEMMTMQDSSLQENKKSLA
jgi:glycosyltransferase involved in cell wall biosynthesis